MRRRYCYENGDIYVSGGIPQSPGQWLKRSLANSLFVRLSCDGVYYPVGGEVGSLKVILKKVIEANLGG